MHDPRFDNYCLLIHCCCHNSVYQKHWMIIDYNTGSYYCPFTFRS